MFWSGLGLRAGRTNVGAVIGFLVRSALNANVPSRKSDSVTDPIQN
jgi:hypothetical protein